MKISFLTGLEGRILKEIRVNIPHSFILQKRHNNRGAKEIKGLKKFPYF